MKRREFITLLGGAATALPLTVRAQQPGNLRTVGLLVPGTRSLSTPWTTVFVQRLHELGWFEGRILRSNTAGPRDEANAIP